jgi:hypothetical protein
MLAVLAPTPSSAAQPGETCNATLTRATWVGFLDAFDRGDHQRLDALFARAPDFQWYSSNPPGLRNLTASKNRATLISYFRARHARRDRMHLLTFAYHGDGNFTSRLLRSASDYKGNASFRLIGKGAVTCAGTTPQLIVVSIGGPGSDIR